MTAARAAPLWSRVAIASRERKPRVFVSASAIGYYGSDRGDEILTEESAPGTDFLADVVKIWEAATAPAADAGVRTVMIRSGIVLAAHGGTLKRLVLPFKAGLGGRIGSGKQWMSWIMLDDEVGAIMHAIDNDVGAGSRQRSCSDTGDERRLHRDARPGAAPPDIAADAAPPLEAACTAPSSSKRCCSRASESRRRSSKRPDIASSTRRSRPACARH